MRWWCARNALGVRLAACALAVAGGAGCAATAVPPAARASRETPTASEQGWRDLASGRIAEARRGFEAELARAPRDPWAAFGVATIAYEHGESLRALEEYVQTLEDLAAGIVPVAAPLATVAAARAADLLDEVPAAALDSTHIEARLLALPRERLAWEARMEMARLGDRIARRRGDPALLEEAARAAGCAREVFEIGTAGGLPHLDLENPLPRAMTASPRNWRALLTPGCRVSVPSWNARPGAQVLRMAIGVPRGRYDVVVDFPGEARLRVDDGAFRRHGDDRAYGPRVSRFEVELGAGRHEIELRLATPSGRSDLGLWVLPRPAATASEPALAPGESGLAVALDYARAFITERLGESDRALAAQTSLAARKTFAAGLSLAAGIARGDVTRPAGFARDAARSLLRAATERDPGAARVAYALGELELDADHPRDAIEQAQRAARSAPAWWVPEVLLATALRSRGLEWDADRALDRAGAKSGPIAGAPCSVVAALFHRAEDRRDLAAQPPLVERLATCDTDSGVAVDRMRARGDLDGAVVLMRRRLALEPDREDLRADLAGVLLAKRDFAGARAELGRLVAEDPSDAQLRVRLADAEVAAGDLSASRRTLAAALVRRPDLPDVRRAARAIGLPLPLDDLRIDAKQVIGDYRATGRKYAAPAVMILDRTVHGVFADGAELILTHNIVAVETKDGIERWGEVTVPSGGEILMLRTHKKDGTTREPEEIAGKEAISAPDLAVGDCVEWETLESKAASDAFAPGFLGERFYFQSFDSPLDRSEYLLLTPQALPLDIDRRAGAPEPTTALRRAPDGETFRLTTFAAREVAQLFAERSAVPAVEYVPSVRVSSGVSWQGWARFLDEQLYGTWRSSPAIRELAATIAAAVRSGAQAPAALARGAPPPPATRTRLAAAIVRWVTDNVEAGDDLRDPAAATLARGRGNRLALVLALARELAVPAVPELVRSRLVADADGVLAPQEVDDFGDTVVRFDVGPTPAYADLRLRHASFGYLPPSLDGAKTLSIDGGHFGVAHGGGSPDQRTVDMTIRLDEKGGGKALATEELTGWPALEWAELMDRFGSDKVKLRQDFEQRWLGVQFPGARLDDLQVEVFPPAATAGAPSTSAATAGGAEAPAAGSSGGHVRVRYSFMSPQLGVRSDQEIKLSPTFFRSQPGRRFAAEPRRSTTLMLGFDVPVRLNATVVLPPSARVIGPTTPPAGLVARKGAYRFLEERTARAGSPEVLLLHRESALPLTRVPPSEYAGVAADLRRVDGLEQQEIRIRLHGAVVGGGAGAR